MNSPLVSLVMPVWRPRADWLREAVAAALEQRGCSIELIAVDDGNAEPVGETLSSFEDPRLQVIRIEHGGATQARNAAIGAARGELLRFIDADDAIPPDSTARLVALNEGRDDLIAYGATMFCDEALRPLWKMTSRVRGDATQACLLGRFTTRPHAFLFPRQVIEKAGGWDPGLTISDDWDLILRALEHASVRGTSEVVTFYRRHPGGMTGDPEEGERGAQIVVERYFERHPEQRGSRLERRARARLMAHAGRVYATHGQPREGMRRLLGAARIDPRAVGVEVMQAAPAAAGLARRLLRKDRGEATPPDSAGPPRP